MRFPQATSFSPAILYRADMIHFEMGNDSEARKFLEAALAANLGLKRRFAQAAKQALAKLESGI